MEFRDFVIKKLLVGYFLAVAGITAAMGIVGSLYAPEATFGYKAFLSPFLFGLVATIPSLATYSKKELSARQMLLRLFLHLALLEVLILLFAYAAGLVTSVAIAVSLVISILIIDITVQLIHWLNDMRIANEINAALKRLRR